MTNERCMVTLIFSDIEETELGEYCEISDGESETDDVASNDKHGNDSSATLTAVSDVNVSDDDTSRPAVTSPYNLNT